MDLANRPGYFRRRDAIADAPTGNRIRLGHGVDDNRAFAHALELGHRDMFYFRAWARIKNVFVNFVSEAERVKLAAQLRDELHLRASENFAGRIIGITDDDRFRIPNNPTGKVF